MSDALQSNPSKALRLLFSVAMLLLTLPLLAQQKPYRGAEFRTKESYTYGRFEVRMRSAAGSGMLTTFFTYHDPVPFSVTEWNEIDIEIMGRYSNEAQYNTITPNIVNHVQRQVVKFNPHLAFHVHGFEWTPDYVAWLVDGYEVYRQTDTHIGTLSHEQKIMMNIWQPNAVAWAGPFDPVTLPFYGYYDWVKYYAYTPGTGDNFTLNWTDTFNSWDQNRWAKATHTFDGNNAQFIPENIEFRNGYMILCLTTPTETGYHGSTILDLDIDPPSLLWARAEPDNFKVFFSEEVEKTSAETVSNYTVAGITLRAATLQPGNKVVELRCDSLDLRNTYVLVVSGIKDRSPAALAMGVQYATVANGLPFPLRINAAGDAAGEFLADQPWDYYEEYGAVGGAAKTLPAGLQIAGTDHPEIYDTQVEGLSIYNLRVPAGTYQVTLMMAETAFNAANRRVFDVYAEGQLALDNLDIFAEVGSNTALEKKTDRLTVNDGVLNLYFKPDIDIPVLSGLVVERLLSTGVHGRENLPERSGLKIFPNPFNPTTRIEFQLEKAGRVELGLYNINGQYVRPVLDEYRAAGTHTVQLGANGLGAGVYVVKLALDGQFIEATKLVYLK